MVNPLITSLAVFGASAAALSVGSAKVINQCDYGVYLCNVPASGGGQEESDKTLQPGESWNQEWTELTNGDGWSIKLSKDSSLENILQYEYTFHNDGIIWYDLSCVNGNPWDKDWEITSSTDSCSPKQQAYRYATDDAYGMQSCSQDASITVTLCSGESVDNGTAVSGSGSGSSGSSSAAPSYSASSSSSAASAPAYTAPSSSAAPAYSAPSATSYSINWYGNDKDAAQGTPTTLATSTTALATDSNGVIVTDIETVVVTQVATAIAYAPSRVKRQQHEHHQHGHQHHA